jgi:hypothetical protein
MPMSWLPVTGSTTASKRSKDAPGHSTALSSEVLPAATQFLLRGMLRVGGNDLCI